MVQQVLPGTDMARALVADHRARMDVLTPDGRMRYSASLWAQPGTDMQHYVDTGEIRVGLRWEIMECRIAAMKQPNGWLLDSTLQALLMHIEGHRR